MYIPRAIEPALRRISDTFPVLLLTGPRQVGKTTVLRHLAEADRTYVTLDDPVVRSLAREEPALFLQRYPAPVLIDEIQYAPELLPYIKMQVDESQKNGGFWLTGSQMFHLMKNVSESLAGRVGVVKLLGLSANEIHQTPSEPFVTDPRYLLERAGKTKKMTLMEVYERIYRGSMPALYSRPEMDTELYYQSYLTTYLQRDIRDLTQVADELAFYNFLRAAAARTARPVVYEDLAKDAGISAPTAKRWLSLLVSSHIVALVQPYHNNVLKRTIKSPLMHFLDTGLCAYLLRWGSPETLEAGAMAGAFFESYVFSEIYKSYLNNAEEPPLYYFRNKDQQEIDVLICKDTMLSPIEIKKSAHPGTQAVRHFRVLSPGAGTEKPDGVSGLKTGVGTGAVVCMASDVLPLDANNWMVPVWVI